MTCRFSLTLARSIIKPAERRTHTVPAVVFMSFTAAFSFQLPLSDYIVCLSVCMWGFFCCVHICDRVCLCVFIFLEADVEILQFSSRPVCRWGRGASKYVRPSACLSGQMVYLRANRRRNHWICSIIQRWDSTPLIFQLNRNSSILLSAKNTSKSK